MPVPGRATCVEGSFAQKSAVTFKALMRQSQFKSGVAVRKAKSERGLRHAKRPEGAHHSDNETLADTLRVGGE